MKRALIPVLVLGSAARFLFLGKRQPWTDELLQALIVRESSIDGLVAHLRAGIWLPAPLDYFAQRVFVLAFGESPWALRLHAAVFGGLSLLVFYRLAQRFFGERVGFYSTLLFAIFPLHFHFSQEGRPWSLMTLVSLFCFDQLTLIVLEGRRGWRDWGTLSFGLALALYTSVHSIGLIASQLAALILLSNRKSSHLAPDAEPGTVEGCPAERLTVQRSDVIRYLIAAGFAMVMFAPWLKFSWWRPGIASAWEIIGPRLLERLLKETGDGSYFITAVIGCGFAVGVAALMRHRRWLDLRWLLSLALVPFPVLLAFDVAIGYFFGIEQVLFATPALALLAGYGLSHVGERLAILSRLPYTTSSPAIVYAAILLVGTGWAAQSHWRDEPIDWIGTARSLREATRPGDALSMPSVGPLLEYYAPELAFNRVTDLNAGPGVLSNSEVRRRVVVCGDSIHPDPCLGFREQALREKSWARRQTRGFTIFTRVK
jgi:uncharacterized membrane protein